MTSNGAALFAFALPLHMLASSYSLAIWLLFTIFYLIIGGYRWSNFLLNLRNSKAIFLLVILYLLLICGLFISDNINEGVSKIEVSIPFIAAPFLFLINKDLIKINVIFNAFITGLSCSVVLSIINLLIESNFTVDGFYADFDLFHHSSYYSMLMNIAIALFLFLHKKINFSNISRYIFILILSVLVFLISSKAGVIVLISLFFVKSIQVVKSSSGLYPKLFFLSFLVVFSILLILNKRVQNMVSNVENIVFQDTPIYPTESTAIRWKIWEKSVKLITKSVVFGYGTGDANAQLLKAYNEEPYLLRHIIKKRYNAHNTFFQLWIMIGFLGPLIIFALLLFVLKKHQYSYFSVGLVLIFLINFCLESMLERHAGVMIFTFFISLTIVCKDSPFFLNKPSH
ncbi:MAG: O-antigen ligase family protein [Flavobacteriales bacterium]|nr:O-antigen ligase family protein [Flavobacteriales bacterium]